MQKKLEPEGAGGLWKQVPAHNQLLLQCLHIPILCRE